MFPPRHFALFAIAIPVVAMVSTASPQGKARPDLTNFPLSAWQEQREVTQIPWNVDIGKPRIRLDLRQELAIWGTVRSEEHSQHDLALFVRATERGNVVSEVHSVPLASPSPISLRREPPITPVGYFSGTVIVADGKYRLELALLDRTTNQYNVRFENVTVEGIENPVERAFEAFDKFEFGRPLSPEEREKRQPELEARAREMSGLGRGGDNPGLLSLLLRPTVLNASSTANASDRPSFVVASSPPTRLSVISILNPPEQAVGNARLLAVFRNNLSNLLSVVTLLRAPNGTARLTGLDLLEQTRVIDQVELKDITPEVVDSAINKDTQTVSVESLAKKNDQGAFLREVLGERLLEGANDNSGTRHVIIVVGAAMAFPNGSRLTIPRRVDCHCQVFYIKFSLAVNETDHIDDILKEFKPQVFEPLTWPEFREDFGKIYGQLR